MHDPNADSEVRFTRLHQQLRLFQTISLLAAVAAAVALYLAIRHERQTDKSTDVLRTRGLVVEDEKGRDRILIGAPVPQIAGGRRQDSATGLLILDENGAERMHLCQRRTRHLWV